MSERGDLVSYERSGLQGGQPALCPQPPPGIVLRRADLAADLAAIDEITRVSFSPAAGEDLAAAELAGLARHPGLAPPVILLAFEGERAAGFIAGRIEVPAAGDGTHRAAVELLAVRPAYRRRGIGRALLDRLLARLAERGVETVVASTDDPIVAAMLEGHGFRRTR